MARIRWWLHTHAATAAYLLIVVIIAGLLAIAVIRGGGW